MIDNEEMTPMTQNVVAKCTKCKTLLDHVVIGRNAEGIIEKVKCLTCGSETSTALKRKSQPGWL